MMSEKTGDKNRKKITINFCIVLPISSISMGYGIRITVVIKVEWL